MFHDLRWLELMQVSFMQSWPGSCVMLQRWPTSRYAHLFPWYSPAVTTDSVAGPMGTVQWNVTALKSTLVEFRHEALVCYSEKLFDKHIQCTVHLGKEKVQKSGFELNMDLVISSGVFTSQARSHWARDPYDRGHEFVAMSCRDEHAIVWPQAATLGRRENGG